MLDFTGKVAFVAGAGSIGPGWGNGKATAVLLARRGARVFGTDISREAATETRALIEKDAAVPIGRMGDAWDVANAVVFLVSDEARYITATQLVVDGGLTAARPA
jgi:NAD(P)-dependent dehydrogenase (short-subunit alcohol dehydrogenase family)